MDIAELRRKTDQAIEEGDRLAAAERQKRRDAAELQEREDAERAEKILAAVPTCCGMAAAKGERRAGIMRLEERKDYHQRIGQPANVLGRDRLIRTAHMVVAGLDALNRCPDGRPRPENERYIIDIEYWHDGAGTEDGFNVVVRW